MSEAVGAAVAAVASAAYIRITPSVTESAPPPPPDWQLAKVDSVMRTLPPETTMPPPLPPLASESRTVTLRR